MTKTIRTLTAGLVVTASALAGSPVDPPTRVRLGFNLFSTEQDREIGRRSAPEIERSLSIVADPAVEAYVNAIAHRLAAFIPGSRFSYTCRVVNDSRIDAFALPGGSLYVTRGLIEAAKSEGQLVGVMAHAMSHVSLRHGTHQASKAYLGQSGLGVLGGLLTKESGTSDELIGAVGGFGPNALFLEFTPAEEEQADIVGAQAMARAGFDPQDMVTFVEVLSRHPAAPDRAARIRSEMKRLRIGKNDQVGGFKAIKAALAAMPHAPPSKVVAANAPAPPRTYAESAGGARSIEAPSPTNRTFEAHGGMFRIEHPSNWQTYRAVAGPGVTLAPEGGLVASGGPVSDLVYGVVVNHYAPFLNDPGKASGLESATDDIVAQILRTNRALRLVPDSRRAETIDGGPAVSVVLSGRSAVTGEDERVTVLTRGLEDDHVVYALLVAPGRDEPEMRETLARVGGSLRIDRATP